MESYQTVIGVNLEAPNVQLGLIKGNKLIKLIETQIDPGQSKKFILNQIIKEIHKLYSKKVLAIGFGIPGALDPKGIVKEVQRIQSWKNVQLKTEIEKEFNAPNKDPKSLIFQFKKIQNKKGKTEELFARVKDVTTQMKLEEKIKKTEIKAQRQTELVLSIIRVEPGLLREFFVSVDAEFEVIDGYIESNRKSKNHPKLLTNIFRSIHLLKGNAGILNLKLFTESAHEFENTLKKLLDQKQLTENDISKTINRFQEIRNDIDEMKNLLFSIGEIHTSMEQATDKRDNALVKTLKGYVSRVSKDFNKKVCLNMDQFNFSKIPAEYKLLTKDLLIQMIRNSIAHGLEVPKDRSKMGKDETGNITISTNFNEDMFSLSVYDDGRGIQTEKLKQKMKNHKNWSGIEIDTLNKSEIIKSIFQPGISTSKSTDITAGRGVGMDAILQKIKSHNGNISVNTEELKFCKIKIDLPNPN